MAIAGVSTRGTQRCIASIPSIAHRGVTFQAHTRRVDPQSAHNAAKVFAGTTSTGGMNSRKTGTTIMANRVALNAGWIVP